VLSNSESETFKFGQTCRMTMLFIYCGLILLTLFTAKKAIQFVKWIWNGFHCKTESGFDN